MPPSVLKALFILLFIASFLVVTRPKSILKLPFNLITKFGKKANRIDNNVNLF